MINNLRLIGNEIFTEFVKTYLAAAEFVDKPERSKAHTWTRQAVIDAENDCHEFLNSCIEKYGADKTERILSVCGMDVSSLAGHDFYLTKNGHGAGFWDDSRWDEIVEKGCTELTKISETIGGNTVCVYYGKLQFC